MLPGAGADVVSSIPARNGELWLRCAAARFYVLFGRRRAAARTKRCTYVVADGSRLAAGTATVRGVVAALVFISSGQQPQCAAPRSAAPAAQRPHSAALRGGTQRRWLASSSNGLRAADPLAAAAANSRGSRAAVFGAGARFRTRAPHESDLEITSRAGARAFGDAAQLPSHRSSCGARQRGGEGGRAAGGARRARSGP